MKRNPARLQHAQMVHMSKGNRYWSNREDGKSVCMEAILCQQTRVQIPSGSDASHAWDKVTCHECLKIMVDDFVRRASRCKFTLVNTKYEKATGFKFPKIIRGKIPPKYEIDPEILERI